MRRRLSLGGHFAGGQTACRLALEDTHTMGAESWASSLGVRRGMKSNRGRDTMPELALRRAVHGLGLRYRVDDRPLPKLRRRADLVFRRARVAVFLDGCFWHGCPQHHTVARTNAEYWASKVLHNRARDAETDRLLAEAGWLVIRIWEHEGTDEAAKRIAIAIRDRGDQPRRTD